MYPLFMAGWMSAFRCQMLPIPLQIPKQVLLKTARRRIGMAWFFKVARGWAPYSKEQSELLEAGFQRFHAGQKEPVVLDQWRVDLEQMSLEWHGNTAVLTIFHKKVIHHGAGVSLVRFDFRGHRLRGWDPQPACYSKIFWFFFPFLISSNFYFSLVAFWIGIE